jgi:hypothetical protein
MRLPTSITFWEDKFFFMPSALKWITTEAKKIRKKYPNRFDTWREYVAQASAIYSSKHGGKSPVGHKHKKSKIMGRKKTIRRKTSKRRKAIVRRVKRLHSAEGRAIRSLGSVSHHLSAARNQLKKKIGDAEARRFTAGKVSVKRKISKRIAKMKKQYRKLIS